MRYTNKLTHSQIARVKFHVPKDGQTEYYFGSLKAIYMYFTEEEIGCKLSTLYQNPLSAESQKVTDKCIISRHTVYRVQRGARNRP